MSANNMPSIFVSEENVSKIERVFGLELMFELTTDLVFQNPERPGDYIWAPLGSYLTEEDGEIVTRFSRPRRSRRNS